jgi:hypothetical protein
MTTCQQEEGGVWRRRAEMVEEWVGVRIVGMVTGSSRCQA